MHILERTPRPRVRVWCRAVGLRVFVYFVRIHTRPTVPRDRSAAALGDDGEGPEILFTSEVNMVGKGLIPLAHSLTPPTQSLPTYGKRGQC